MIKETIHMIEFKKKKFQLKISVEIDTREEYLNFLKRFPDNKRIS